MKNKTLHMDLQLTPITIVADEDLLSHVWMNIIGNSMKFTPNNGTITISLTNQPTGWTQVTITDTGIGIPDQELTRVFERFYKVDRSRRRDGNGSGLGLAIVNKVIALHQGTVSIASRTGEGTTVTIRLRSPNAM